MRIQTIRGTHDILPGEIELWQAVEEVARRQASLYGFSEIRTPVFEDTRLFLRGIGESTDIVGKEMYTFTDKNDESVTLRPEMTASIARAVVQHSLLEQNPVARLWYFGPMFRRERPQKGRQRQFHQFGAELLGARNPEADAEVIALAWSVVASLGITRVRLEINTLGSQAARAAYRAALVEYFTPHREELSEDSRNRLDTNPLRILDSKSPADAPFVERAPRLHDFLDDESRSYWQQVCALLDALEIPYTVSDRLVRGLDYYEHTVFELIGTELGAQAALGGGGRYDGLVEQLGGKPSPGVGFALGAERLLIAMEAEKVVPPVSARADVMVIALGDDTAAYSLRLLSLFRRAGLSAVSDVQRRSMKAQFREANRLGAKAVCIIGADEVAAGTAAVKILATGEQTTVAFAHAAAHVLSAVGQ
jgi:histidyl-tRNA synthetase